MIVWSKFERADGTIDLQKAWKGSIAGHEKFNEDSGLKYLELVEAYQKIKSKQVAACCLAQADLLSFLVNKGE